MTRYARLWHTITAVVTIVALAFQLWLALSGHRTLVTEGQPSTRTTLVRFFSYFTILSNILVAVTTSTLALGSDRNSRLWRVLRMNAVVGIAVTAIVHWFFLRPLLDLHGNDYLADKLLHVVVPALAVVGWLVFGPRGRVQRGDLLPSAIYPALYMVWTLVHGATSRWYPYPFTDVTEHGYPTVLVNAGAVIALLAALSALMLAIDGRLPGAASPQSSGAGSGSPSR
ncbi:MAG: Pr6Pr family membrane protein [Marmoricola sp.]